MSLTDEQKIELIQQMSTSLNLICVAETLQLCERGYNFAEAQAVMITAMNTVVLTSLITAVQPKDVDPVVEKRFMNTALERMVKLLQEIRNDYERIENAT